MNRRFLTGAVLAVLALAASVVGCGQPAPSPPPAASSPPTQTPAGVVPTAAPTASPSESPVASASPGAFEFDAESVRLFYASLGYSCADAEPSTQAADHWFVSCRRVDEEGLTHLVGLVIDAEGFLANGFAGVQAAPDEPFLDPTVALEPMAGFLGAMLGEARGEALLPWLAGHLGDLYAETTADGLVVATYTASEDDRNILYVELATPAYLVAPTPGA